jgi:hypothetical protein
MASIENSLLHVLLVEVERPQVLGLHLIVLRVACRSAPSSSGGVVWLFRFHWLLSLPGFRSTGSFLYRCCGRRASFPFRLLMMVVMMFHVFRFGRPGQRLLLVCGLARSSGTGWHQPRGDGLTVGPQARCARGDGGRGLALAGAAIFPH